MRSKTGQAMGRYYFGVRCETVKATGPHFPPGHE